MTLWCRRMAMPLTCVCSWRISGEGLQGAAEAGLHVLGQQARGGPQPVWLFPASLSWLAQASGAAGSTDCPVVHLNQEVWVTKGPMPAFYPGHCQHPGSLHCPSPLPEPCPVPAVALTRLTASVAMPSMAAPPTPSTSRALASTKSMAVPMPLSSFFPLRCPAPAILPAKSRNVMRVGQNAWPRWVTPFSHTSHSLLPAFTTGRDPTLHPL